MADWDEFVPVPPVIEQLSPDVRRHLDAFTTELRRECTSHYEAQIADLQKRNTELETNARVTAEEATALVLKLQHTIRDLEARNAELDARVAAVASLVGSPLLLSSGEESSSPESVSMVTVSVPRRVQLGGQRSPPDASWVTPDRNSGEEERLTEDKKKKKHDAHNHDDQQNSPSVSPVRRGEENDVDDATTTQGEENKQNKQQHQKSASVGRSKSRSVAAEDDAKILLYAFRDVSNLPRSWNIDVPLQGTVWQGVTVKNGRVREIHLAYQNLQGQVDFAALHALDALVKLHLENNELTNSINAEEEEDTDHHHHHQPQQRQQQQAPLLLDLSKLPSRLEVLNLSWNKFRGDLDLFYPDSFPPTLEVLDLHHNEQLSGSIDVLTLRRILPLKLRLLNCSSCNFSGQVWKSDIKCFRDGTPMYLFDSNPRLKLMS